MLSKKIKNIKIIVSDVDGVLTDGKIYFDANGGEMKVFSVKDSFRVEIWLRSGGKMIWFTGRKSEGLIRRAKELGIELVFKSDISGGLLEYIKDKHNITPSEILYVGDDWSDLYYMSNVGLSVAPTNATKENLKTADWVTKSEGGQGVLSEIIERVMREQGNWTREVTKYKEKFIL